MIKLEREGGVWFVWDLGFGLGVCIDLVFRGFEVLVFGFCCLFNFFVVVFSGEGFFGFCL